jgi:hypothetical protein
MEVDFLLLSSFRAAITSGGQQEAASRRIATSQFYEGVVMKMNINIP